MSASRRRKVVFVAEAVTLAHMARPAVLASGLRGSEFDPVLARDPRYAALFPGLDVPEVDISSIHGADFVAALAKGAPLYSSDTLKAYVEQDLALIERESPDIVVGDFRLSLAVSARLSGVPYLAISNAYWSPYARVSYPIPEHPLTALLGVPVANALFKLARPVAFALHSLPLNRVCRYYGLPALGLDLNRVYTEADQVLYADLPQLVEMADLPADHGFMGPVLWSPQQRLPDWWQQLDPAVPAIYLTLGSSGRADLLPLAMEALAELPLQLLVSTAGQPLPAPVADNVFCAEYLPGDAATERASLVVCNGGSLSTYQAFACGRPVLGIAGNLDQHLNMAAVQAKGAGECLRSDSLDGGALRQAAVRLLDSSSAAEAARSLGAAMDQMSPPSLLAEALRRFD